MTSAGRTDAGARRVDAREHAWAVLLAVHRTLVDRMEAALAAAGLPSLAWYDVLWALENAERGRLRMHELADRVVLSRSNLTRLADRLEADKLIAREPSAEDRRGAYCVLLPAGRAMRKRMWPVYSGAIEALWSRPITSAEGAAVGVTLEKVLRAARAAEPGA